MFWAGRSCCGRSRPNAPAMGRHRWNVGGGSLKAFARALLLIVSAAAGAHGAGDTNSRTIDRPVAREIARWNTHIEEASARFGIPRDWIRRVMRAESGGRTALASRPITSSAGAMGLMQLMPGTWAEMRSLHGLGPDPHDPHDNILAGTAFLRAMYDRFGYPGLFAAYNAGPGRYARHLAASRRLPAETAAYVAAIGLIEPEHALALRKAPPGAGVLVALAGPRPSDLRSTPAPAAQNALFVRLSTVSAASE